MFKTASNPAPDTLVHDAFPGRLQVGGHLIIRRWCSGKQAAQVIIMDEAQHLRNDALEDLRLLTNYETGSENWLCLLFVGLTQLRRCVHMSVHELLDQRIVLHYHLSALARGRISEHVIYLLRVADCNLPWFAPATVKEISHAKQAMPHEVNRMAHYALLAGHA